MTLRQWTKADVETVAGGWQPTGKFFRRWTNDYAVCRCACGKLGNVGLRADGSLKTKRCSSCANKQGRYRLAHGHTAGPTSSSTWVIWMGMVARCSNPRNASYKNYGGRGVVVCERWHLFENFLADMGERPKGMTLDRRDNDGNYGPDNCRWATMLEQGRNKRNNVLVTYQGRTLPISAWAEVTGLPYVTLYNRRQSGWPDDEIIATPRRSTRPRTGKTPVSYP